MVRLAYQAFQQGIDKSIFEDSLVEVKALAAKTFGKYFPELIREEESQF